MTSGNPVPTPDVRTTAGRQWLGLAVLMLPALLASLELTVTHLALPTIGADLDAGSAEQLWIVDIYAFMLSGAMLAMGSVGDRIGRRRLLLIGAAVFAAASVLAAYAPTVEALIAVRALMGIAGSTLMPSILALTAVLFPEPNRRRIAIGAVIASVSAGTAIGPLVGGWLLEEFWWGSVFLIGVPVLAPLLVLGPRLLPEQRTSGRSRIDLASALLTIGAVLLVVYALKEVATGSAGPHTVGLLIAGVVLGLLFVRRQQRLTDPMIDLTLFRHAAFSVALLTLALGIFVLWGTSYAIAQYLQLVQGFSPLHAGLWTAPSALGVIAGSTIAPHLANRFPPAMVIGAGLLISALGFAILSQLDAVTGLPTLVIGAIVVSAGLGPMMALATELVISAAPLERAGSASAMASMSPQLGGAIGIAAIGSIIAATYRGQVRGAFPPDTADQLRARAEDSLAGGIELAERLRPAISDEVADLAREAFTAGFRLIATLSGAATLLLAVVVIIVLRPRRRISGQPRTGGDTRSV